MGECTVNRLKKINALLSRRMRRPNIFELAERLNALAELNDLKKSQPEYFIGLHGPHISYDPNRYKDDGFGYNRWCDYLRETAEELYGK